MVSGDVSSDDRPEKEDSDGAAEDIADIMDSAIVGCERGGSYRVLQR